MLTEDIMDKQEILDQLRSFPYDRNGYWVIAGSAMVLWGDQKADR